MPTDTNKEALRGIAYPPSLVFMCENTFKNKVRQLYVPSSIIIYNN